MMLFSLPKLAIVGNGRAGKDTAAEWFRENTVLRFVGGSSWHGRLYVAEKLGITPQEAWETRHQRRMEWYTLLNEYRREDPTRLIRDCLSDWDIVCGIRDGIEMQAAIDAKLIDLVIWVDRDVPKDPTLTFGEELADIILPNRWTVAELYQRLEKLARSLRILRS